jgi:uncharacterized protein YbjT (DUF2867 family)
MFLLTGADTLVGRHVVQALDTTRVPVRALVPARCAVNADEFGAADLVTGDVSDRHVLDAALDQVETLVLCSRAHPDLADSEGRLLEAAERHGVRRVLKLSVAGAAHDAPVQVARWHWAAEKRLAATAFHLAIVRAHRSMQHLYAQVDSLCSQHAFYGCQGDGLAVDVDVRDVASVLAHLAIDPPRSGHVWEVTGPAPHSAHDVAAAMGAAMGTPVTYVDCPPADFVRSLLAGGTPRWKAEDRALWQLLIRRGDLATPTDAVHTITGRAPRTLEAFASEFAAALRHARMTGPPRAGAAARAQAAPT